MVNKIRDLNSTTPGMEPLAQAFEFEILPSLADSARNNAMIAKYITVVCAAVSCWCPLVFGLVD